MVTVFENCNRCVNSSSCPMKEDLKGLRDDVDKRFRTMRAFTQDSVSIAIRCNRYKSDYGKGMGM